MLMSDGVAEAQNTHGELFGFERIEEMLRNHTTTAEILLPHKYSGRRMTSSCCALRPPHPEPSCMSNHKRSIHSRDASRARYIYEISRWDR